MARNIGADGRTVYRAVIEKTYADGRTYTAHEGPYTDPGPARARVTFWRNRMERNDGTAEGRIEQAHTIWAPVDGKEQRPAERAAAAIRAQAYRDAAAEIEALQAACEAEDRKEFGEVDRDTVMGTEAVRRGADALRRMADEIHPAAKESDQ